MLTDFSARLRATLPIALALALGFNAVHAADTSAYPEQPIKLVVPFPAGGSTDISARLIGKKVSEILKQPVLVDNKPGAASNIGASFVAHAPADGYTLLMATSATLAVNASLYKDLSFDPVKDFKPIILTTTLPSIVVVSKDRGINTMAELNAALKKGGDKMFYASPGSGTPSHLGTELYKRSIGSQAVHVPYKGGAPALTDMVGNRADFMIAVVPESIPFVRSGQLKALAVTTKKRLPYLPDLPTVAESGVPGYELIAWYAIVAPAKTPDAIAQKLNAAFNEALADKATAARLVELGFDPVGGPAKDLADLAASETAKWGKVVRDAHITVD